MEILIRLNVKLLNWLVIRILKQNAEVVYAPLPTPDDFITTDEIKALYNMPIENILDSRFR